MESSCSDLGKWDSGREMNVIKKQRDTIGQQEYKVYCKWEKQEGGERSKGSDSFLFVLVKISETSSPTQQDTFNPENTFTSDLIQYIKPAVKSDLEPVQLYPG